MAQNIKLKRSSVAGKVPTVAQLEAGELAINTADGKLYFERDDSTIQSIVTTNAVITGSVNINGPITGSDVRINQWGSVSASLATISSQAAVVPTLDQVTDQGSTTTNFIEVGSISAFTTGGFIAGVFKTTDGPNTVILESAGTGGTNPGSTILQFRDSKGTQKNASITYGGNAADYLRLNTSAGATFGITGSSIDSTYVFNGNDSGTGSFSWDLGTTFIQKVGGGTTRFLGNATTATSASFATTASFAISASYAPGTSQNLQQVTDNGNTTTNSITAASFTGSLLGTASYASFAATASTSDFVNILSTSLPNTYYVTFNGGTGYQTQLLNGSMEYRANTDTLVVTNISSSGLITGSDVQIDDWGSVSASLATIQSGANTVTLQDVTDNGNTTTNSITAASFTGSLFGTASFATQALSASYAVSASHAELADLATNSTYAQNVTVTGKNLSGGTIAKGTPLYFTGSGTAGNLVGIFPADAGNPARMPAGGIAGEAITDGSEGLVLLNGYIDGVDTSTFFAGDEVFVAAGGGYTRIAPTGSALVQKLGNIEKISSVNGSGVINGPGTARSVPNIASGFTWVGAGNGVATPTAVSSLSVANAVSASYASTADAVGVLNQNVTIAGNLNVFGTASFTYTTASQLNVEEAFISVNVATPAQRFGGLAVYDSGSTNVTASLAYDSLNNDWKFFHEDVSTADYSVLIFGPLGTDKENTPKLTGNWITKAQNDGHGHHIGTSSLFDDGTVVRSIVPVQVTGSLTTTGKLTVGTVDNYGADPDKFLSIVNGEVVYRTGAQLLSDIGGQTAGTFVQNDGSGGTARYIMRYADSNSATTSSIYEDTAGRIGIKTTAPSYSLDINGQARVSTSSNVGAYVKTTSAFGAVISYQDSTTPASEFVTAGAYGKGFVIGTDGQVKVIVDSTGSIGVGTLTPVNAPDERGITISGIAGAGYYFDVSSETTSLKNNQGTIELNYSYGGVKFNAPGGTRMELASVGNLTLNRYGQGNFVTDTPVSLLAAGNNSGYVMEVTHLKFNSGTTTVSGSLIISGSTDVIQQGIKVTGTGSLTVTSISTTSYDGAFLDYLIVSGSNKRAGTLTTVWTASDIEWKDTSTLDLGSTDGAEFAPAINGSNADLVLSLPTGTWTVKGHLRYM